jgi:hypothetical protein
MFVKPGDMACLREAAAKHMPGAGLLLMTISFLDVLAFSVELPLMIQS